MHYHNRYKAHTDSFKLESKLKETILEKVSISEERESRLRDFSWVNNGLYRLFRSRRVLSYSYPFAFYMFGEELFKDEMTTEEREIKQNLFEDQQQQLESNVEKLSKFLEEPFEQYTDEKVMEIRMQVINLSTITDNLCKKMYECIESDLLGALQLGTHNIAPYKSKGIEKASELSSCWSNKVNTADKCLPSDGNTSGGASQHDKPSGSRSSADSGCSSWKRARRDGVDIGTFSTFEGWKNRIKTVTLVEGNDPVQRKVEKHEPNNMCEASHNLELEKMEQLEDSVKAKNRLPPNAEVQDSLKEEIVELQDRLQNQFVMRHALEKAMSYYPFSYDTMNDNSIPKATKELIKEIAVLELEVVHLERIHQYHSSISQRSIGSPSRKSVSRTVDTCRSLPLSMLENNNSHATCLVDYLGTNIQDYVCETPNLLSEEMIRCISSIYCKLADPPLIVHDYPSSPVSFSSSQTDLPAQGKGEMWSFNSSIDNPFHIGQSKELSGPYCTMATVHWIHRDSYKLKDVQHKLQDFRSLVSQLEAADPRKLKQEEKLAFWINVHNALVMHAFLVYGIPCSSMKRTSLLLKAAYNVGGHTVNVDMIQNSILGCHLLRPGQWLRHLFSFKPKFKAGDPRKSYSIDHSEPLLHFALNAGRCSDPVVRVYTPKRVFEDLEAAKEEYIRSNLIIHQDKKLHLPKLVECYAKELDLCPDGLLDMIEHLLPNSLRKSIQDCQRRKHGKSIEWIHHNFEFRYLLSRELV
ncbi:hypothetical protein GH714_011325 [Hevea brasiliensis]|uniref:DUF547 domain-containing protein n=1 Tax=Hevea brasiliensis TaxID=3981 RepID=A0A6A6KZF7_HEVBR|nr:hypothetical protein GH714_011325 [Hevea brasiliensis]